MTGQAVPSGRGGVATTGTPPDWGVLLDEQWCHHLAEYTRLSIDRCELDEAGVGTAVDTPVDPAAEGLVPARRRAARLVADQRHALAEVESALARFAAGTHGVCEDCGHPIHPHRLEVVPQTRYCTGCARTR